MTPPAGRAPRGELGAFSVGCIVVGGIVGVGIFFTPARVAAAVDTPGQVALAWALGGLLAALGALVFAELSTLVPGHGGTFRYLHAAFGRTPAFLYGWCNWLVIQAGALGAVGLVLVDNLEVALGGARFGADAKVWLATTLILLFTATNAVGLRAGVRTQNLLTVAKALSLGALVWLAATTPPAVAAATPAEPSGRSLPAMLAAAILPALFAIGGWQQGSFVAGACRNPRRDMPLGILGGVAVVLVVYLAINLAFLSLLGFDAARTSARIGADAASVALGASGGRIVAAMIVVSAAGILNTICLAPPYVLYAMAQEGLFPAAFGRLHPRLGTPLLGVLGQGLWGAALLLFVHYVVARGDAGGALGFVCDSVVFADWVFYALCGAALWKLRGTRSDALRIPGGAVAAAAFVAGSLAVTAGAIWQHPEASLAGLGLAALGLPFARRRAGGSPATAADERAR